MKIVFVRHGKTEGNTTKKYVGRTDEPLCKAGREAIRHRVEEGRYPAVTMLFTSPMQRCRETASLIYGTLIPKVCEGFRECDFGEFEYKNHLELTGNPKYQEWIESNGMNPFPGGESIESFRERCVTEFKAVMQEVENACDRRKMNSKEQSIGIVVHGGTIMAILSALCSERQSYFDWMVENGCGYVCEYDKTTGRLQVVEEINE